MLDKFEEDRKYLEALQRRVRKNEDNNYKVHYEYVIHLIESLNRLMSLAT